MSHFLFPCKCCVGNHIHGTRGFHPTSLSLDKVSHVIPILALARHPGHPDKPEGLGTTQKAETVGLRIPIIGIGAVALPWSKTARLHIFSFSLHAYFLVLSIFQFFCLFALDTPSLLLGEYHHSLERQNMRETLLLLTFNLV